MTWIAAALALISVASLALNGWLYAKTRHLTAALALREQIAKEALAKISLPIPGESHEERTARIIRLDGRKM